MNPAVTITIPARTPWLTANATTNRHWRHRQTLVTAWRDTTTHLARQHRLRHVTSPYHVTATIWTGDARARDLDGLTATIKACIDGLRAANVLDDDNTRHMTRLTIAHGGIDRDHPRVEITVHEETPA